MVARSSTKQYLSHAESLGLPLVSVIVPAFNRRDRVDETIESILAQDWPRLELIVVDDGSSDGTGDYVSAKWGAHVLVVRQDNGGPSAARNAGFRASSGQFLTSMDSDDVMLPGAVRARATVLMDHPEADLAYGRYLHQSRRGAWREGPRPLNYRRCPWPRGDLFVAYVRKPFFRHTDVLFRRCLLPADGALYDPQTFVLEDYLMVLRLLAGAHAEPAFVFSTGVRCLVGAQRARFDYEKVLRQGLGPVERALRDPLTAERMQSVISQVRARFLLEMANAARRLRYGRLYRQCIDRAKKAHPPAVAGFRHLRRRVLSYLLRRQPDGGLFA